MSAGVQLGIEMYDRVLVPTDGTETVEQTLPHALSIAADNDATVHALYVVDNRLVTAAEGDATDDLRDSLEADGEAAVADVADRAAAEGLETVEAVRTGTPWKEVLAYADEADCDLIVIGAHGKTPKEKIVSLGSVSERVVDNASIPVFVVRRGRSE
ncbi:Nucleotide-binding universal stress protein, UspA family [Halopenitus malekzadehii]|uniref:Nucleotide-binding universal stress protein, UspA family n=2 Tax=Halopenitus malekzadehii TaxID=1267564 RepID=A0A1H6HWW8_9EURY|nr:Nucleotide-binding universal stress protein, UspA family [Halopenitus malekzadehii]